MYNFISKKISNSSDLDVLDIGCGYGYGSFIMAVSNTNYRVLGIDICDECIARSKKYFKVENLNFKKLDILQDIELIKKKLGRFDIITCLEVLEHISKEYVLKLLNNIRNLLKPEGRAYISTPNKPIYDVDSYTENHINELNLDDFRMLLDKAGFKIINIYGVNKVPVILYRIVEKFNLSARIGDKRNDLNFFGRVLRKVILSLDINRIIKYMLTYKKYIEFRVDHSVNSKPYKSKIILAEVKK